MLQVTTTHYSLLTTYATDSSVELANGQREANSVSRATSSVSRGTHIDEENQVDEEIAPHEEWREE